MLLLQEMALRELTRAAAMHRFPITSSHAEGLMSAFDADPAGGFQIDDELEV